MIHLEETIDFYNLAPAEVGVYLLDKDTMQLENISENENTAFSIIIDKSTNELSYTIVNLIHPSIEKRARLKRLQLLKDKGLLT
ncbi:MAG: hypothetical protein HRT41_12845 [Campylobacteraceae bacterium]|nr:hypothetical protein [Campylobacteraceae bacterium]